MGEKGQWKRKKPSFNLYIIEPCLLYNTKTGTYIKQTTREQTI